MRAIALPRAAAVPCVAYLALDMIQITRATYEALQDDFVCERAGEIGRRVSGPPGGAQGVCCAG